MSLPSRLMDEKVMIPWVRIEALLAEADRSQTWLATRLNVSTNVVTNWKLRGGVPGRRARAIAEVFGIALVQLLEDAGEPVQQSKAAVRLVQRIGELDRKGLWTKQAEAAAAAFLDLLEGTVTTVRGKTRV